MAARAAKRHGPSSEEPRRTPFATELGDELDDAEARHDAARHANAKRSTERDALLKELARATGLGGKPRRAGSPTEKARLNVTRTIRHATRTSRRRFRQGVVFHVPHTFMQPAAVRVPS
jgi:hypothetical protein